MTDSSLRLNKYLALQLGVSRREADLLIEKGKVTINGAIAVLGQRLSSTDTLLVNQKALTRSATLQYIALNKPTGYVCSRRQQGETPTIYSLLPTHLHELKPVGRLDKDSSGLILLTNDGDFAHHMTHPSFRKTKTYEISLDQDLAPLHQQMISEFGVQLEDGSSRLALTKLNDTSRRQWQVSMHEGRNRQIRRTFSALGYDVQQLHRTSFGAYQLNDLAVGKWQSVPKV